MKPIALTICLVIACFSMAPAQSADPVATAKSEIEATFGKVPILFSKVPEAALPGFWAHFKSVNDPNSVIPAKYRELMQLAVASQIPCDYCVFFHIESAKAYGATEKEIKETVYNAAATRSWSTLMYGNQIDMEAFKKEMKEMMAYMAKQSGKK